MPDEPRCTGAAFSFDVELSPESFRNLNQYSLHLHENFRALHNKLHTVLYNICNLIMASDILKLRPGATR